MSDFDYDDDLFSDVATLAAIDEVANNAIAASQAAPAAPKPAPKRTLGARYHHTVSGPTSGRSGAPAAAAPVAAPAAGASRPVFALARPSKTPAALNTAPRVSNCGFGWETGGKHAVRAEQMAARTGPSAAAGPSRSAARPAAAANDDDDDDDDMPMVTLDNNGRYGIDNERPADPRDARAAAPTLHAEGERSLPNSQRMPLPGSQARREAIEAAMANNHAPQLGMRGPIQRSTSSTSTGAIPNAPLLGAPRSLARSISTGAQVFARPPIGGPARGVGTVLAPIPSQGSQGSSQGAVARRAVVELEEEKRLRAAAQAELQMLKEQLSATRDRSAPQSPWHDEVQAGDVDWEGKAKEYQQQLWAAQGVAATAKRNQESNESTLKAEIDRLRLEKRDVEVQMRAREADASKNVESMKSQAVFSHHNARASASKARHQSQWIGSQRAGAPTPMKGGSPLREKAMMTPGPRSAMKGKGRAVPVQRFDNMTNAFNIASPSVGSRAVKRQTTEPLSPTTTPKKQRSQQIQSGSPKDTSPTRSQGQHSQGRSQVQQSQSRFDDVQMDYQPDFSSERQPAVEEMEDEEEPRDPKQELIHHLLNHVASSPVQQWLSNDMVVAAEPTIMRIVGAEVELVYSEGLPPWKAPCRELVQLCGDNIKPFDDIARELMRVFAVMVTILTEEMPKDDVFQAGTLINVLRFVGSTILFFPSLPDSNPDAGIAIADALRRLAEMISPPTNTYGKEGAWMENTRFLALHDDVVAPDQPDQVPWALAPVEIADAVVEVAEALCLADGKCVWTSDQLSFIIILFASAKNPITMVRGIDLFVIASCRQDHFRAVLFAGSGTDVPVVDHVARFLIGGHKGLDTEQMLRSSVAVLGALFALSRHDADNILLMSDTSVLIPALLTIIHRESSRIWGIRAIDTATYNPLTLLSPAIILLHHLVFPPPLPRTTLPSASQPVQQSQLQQQSQGASSVTSAATADAPLFAGRRPHGVDLNKRLNEVAIAASKEFSGIQHVFVSALGSMAYADPAEEADTAAWGGTTISGDAASKAATAGMAAGELRVLQYLAEDLLMAVAEGPEGDQVYELYAPDEEGGGSDEAGAEAAVVVEDDDDGGDQGADAERMIGAAEEWGMEGSPIWVSDGE